MRLNGGAVVIILILGACAAAAIYFTVKGYLVARRDPFAADETPAEAPKIKEKPEERQKPKQGSGPGVPPSG